MAPGVLRGLVGGCGGGEVSCTGKESWGPEGRPPRPAFWEIPAQSCVTALLSSAPRWTI